MSRDKAKSGNWKGRLGKSVTKRASTFFEFFGRLMIVVIASIIVPVVVGYTAGDKVSTIEKVYLGLLVFLVSSMLQLNIEIALMKKRDYADIDLWDVQGDADAGLANVRKSFWEIVRRRNALYRDYFAQRIAQLESAIVEAAANNEELLVDQDSDTTLLMLKEFSGEDEHIIRFIHYFSDNEFLFDVHASHFFSEVARKVESGDVKEVKRIFIFNDAADLEDARSLKLLQFHVHSRSFACKVMPSREFERLKLDFRLPLGTHDFGIYGKWYVYCSKASVAHEVKGVFISAEHAVQRFTNFFESCWVSQFAADPGVPSSPEVGLQELFARSSVSPNRPKDANQFTNTLLPDSGPGITEGS